MQDEYQILAPKSDEDFRKYYDFRHLILRKPWDMPPGSEKDKLEEQSIHRMIVDKNDNVVAVGRIHFNGETEAQSRYIATADSCRGKGLGTKLMQELEKVAREGGAKEMMVDSRETAVDFYLKNGYKITKDSNTMIRDIKHKEMRKVL